MSSVSVVPAATGLRGAVEVPGDKSIAHRALMLGAIADGDTVIRGFPGGADNLATLAACRGLGVPIEEHGSEILIHGHGWDGLVAPPTTLDCGNSGTTMRLLAGLLAGRPFPSRLDGDASLRRRPMRRVLEPLGRMGATIRAEGTAGGAPLVVEGGLLHPTTHELAVASAQVKSALILAALQAHGETSITEPARSRDHTERMIRAFGGRLDVRAEQVVVSGPQQLRGTTVSLPGDLSSAAFLIVAALVVPGSDLELRHVGLNPTRTGVLDVLAAMGAELDVSPTPAAETGEPVGTIRARTATLRGTRIAGEMLVRAIDEFPILCIAAACASGRTEFADAAELRVKESDRIATMAEMLRTLGATVEERPDGLVVEGPATFGGGRIASGGDHRVAMAATVAGLISRAGVTIEDAACADVSFPGFYETMARLTARAEPR